MGGEPVRGMFSLADVDMSSTYRELKAVFYVLKSYANSLKHQKVKVFVNNMGASRILMVAAPSLIYSGLLLTYLLSVCLLAFPWIGSGCLTKRTLVPIYSAGLSTEMIGV